MTQNPSTEPDAAQVAPQVASPVPDQPYTEVAPAPEPAAPVSTRTSVRRSRFGGLWVGLIVAAAILVLLLIFILQNSQSVQIEFLWLSGRAPLAVAILLGVAAGALLVAVPGTVRILQLRKSVRHSGD